MREMFRRNLGYKIISLILAILFWLWVTFQGSTETVDVNQTLTIPLITKNLPVDSVVMTKLPSVRVKVQGVNPSVNVKELYAYVDLSDSKPGENTYDIEVVDIPNMKVLEVNPKTIKLEIDTIKENMFPVKLTINGTPAEGKKLGEAIISPEMVNVRGPSSLLASISIVGVEVNVEGANDTVKASRPLFFRDKNGQAIYGPDPSVENIIATPSSVDIIVPIIPKELSSKMIPVKVSQRGKPAEGYEVRSIQIFPEGVQIVGPVEALSNLNSLNIGTVDLSGITDDLTQNFSSDGIALPKGVSFETPTKFRVIVDIGQSKQTKAITLGVNVKNIADNLKLESELGSVDIMVRGMPEVLKTLTSDQISLWVDAAGLGAGSYPNAKVFWQLPAGIEMVSVPEVSFNLVEKIENPNPEEPEAPPENPE